MWNETKLVVALLCLFPLLVSCTTVGRQAQATSAQTKLVGITKSQLFSCAGVPDKSLVDGDTEYYSYSMSGNAGVVRVFSNAAVIRQGQCTATVEVVNGSVSSITYRAAGSGLLVQQESCGPIFAGCL